MNLTGLLQDPYFNLGTNILAQQTGGLGAYGKGVQQSTLQQQQRAQLEQKNKLRELQMQQAQRALDTPAERKIVKGADGYNYYMDGTRVLPNAQRLPEKPTDNVSKYLEAQKSYPIGSPTWKVYQDAIIKATTSKPLVEINGEKTLGGYLTKEEKAQGGLDIDSPYVWNKQGIPTPVKPTSYTEGQLTAAGFADRMYSAENNIDGLTSQGLDPTRLTHSLGGSLGAAGNFILDDKQQVYQQAMHDWVRAKLRKESGAVIGEDEMIKEIRTYFPMPGDSQAVVEAKARAREIATQGMATMSGGKYEYKPRDTLSETSSGKKGGEDGSAIDEAYLKSQGLL